MFRTLFVLLATGLIVRAAPAMPERTGTSPSLAVRVAEFLGDYDTPPGVGQRHVLQLAALLIGHDFEALCELHGPGLRALGAALGKYERFRLMTGAGVDVIPGLDSWTRRLFGDISIPEATASNVQLMGETHDGILWTRTVDWSRGGRLRMLAGTLDHPGSLRGVSWQRDGNYRDLQFEGPLRQPIAGAVFVGWNYRWHSRATDPVTVQGVQYIRALDSDPLLVQEHRLVMSNGKLVEDPRRPSGSRRRP